MRGYVDATWGWEEVDQARRFDTSFDPARALIIQWHARPIGMLVVDHGANPVKVCSLEILPAQQNRGHGTAVLSGVIARAGDQPVWLQVLKVNPAKAWYQRLGFVVVGQTATHWQMLRAPSA
ncbi:GNAT family N-acetyltransferase [Lysobacter koreensis]